MPSLKAGGSGRVSDAPDRTDEQGSLMENVFNLPQGFPHLVRQGQTDAQEMATLLEIGQTLADGPHLRPAMSRALELLGRALGVSRGFVMLLDAETEELRVEAAYGLD